MTLGKYNSNGDLTWTSGQELVASEVNTTVGGTYAPIGTIIGWLKTLTGVPSLPAGWVECNGQTLDDETSPYDDEVIPDLNGDNRFLRGNSTSGGTGGEDTTAGHTHTYSSSGAAVASDLSLYVFTGTPLSTTSTHDNRPSFYNVVWIMRVK